MLKSSVIVLLIAASSGTSGLPSSVLTGKMLGRSAGAPSDAAAQTRVDDENSLCRTARLQIAISAAH